MTNETTVAYKLEPEGNESEYPIPPSYRLVRTTDTLPVDGRGRRYSQATHDRVVLAKGITPRQIAGLIADAAAWLSYRGE